MPPSAVLLLLQGVSEFIKCWGRAFGRATGETRGPPSAEVDGADAPPMSAEWFGILLARRPVRRDLHRLPDRVHADRRRARSAATPRSGRWRCT